MKAARLVVLGVAVAAGGIAAYLASGSKPAAPPPVAEAPPPMETVEVLVSKIDLNRGDVIGEQDIGWQTWPAAAANPSFIKKAARPDAMKDFIGAIVRVAMVAGDPIRDPYVVMAKGSGFLAAVLPKNMRAVSVDIAPDSGAGGFILPDDRVDVLVTRRDRAAEKATGIEKFATDTILRNVRVLAIDQAIDEKAGTKAVIGKTATLELSEQQAETLQLSKQLGTISLTLRSILDSQGAAEGGGDNKEGAINTVRFGVSTLGTSH